MVIVIVCDYSLFLFNFYTVPTVCACVRSFVPPSARHEMYDYV